MWTDVKLIQFLRKYSGNGGTSAISQYQTIFSPTWPGNEARVQPGPYIQPHSNFLLCMHKWLPLEAFYFSLSFQALAFLDQLPFNATKMLLNNASVSSLLWLFHRLSSTLVDVLCACRNANLMRWIVFKKLLVKSGHYKRFNNVNGTQSGMWINYMHTM